MKKALLVFLLFTGVKIFSQDTLTYSNLSKEQYSTWKVIEDKWIKEQLRPYLKKRKIVLNCAGCESVYLGIVFTKDSLTTTYKVIWTRRCGAPFSKLQMNEIRLMINEIQLPAEFSNTTFKVNLGLALKC